MAEATQQHSQTVASAETSLGRREEEISQGGSRLSRPGSITCVVASGPSQGPRAAHRYHRQQRAQCSPRLMEERGCAMLKDTAGQGDVHQTGSDGLSDRPEGTSTRGRE